MEYQNTNPHAFQHKRQGQDTNFKSQLKTIFRYLQNHAATVSMVSAETGIPHKNICRFKRDLQNNGKLWEIEKKPCEKTGFKAWYLTTNPDKVPFNNQFKTF